MEDADHPEYGSRSTGGMTVFVIVAACILFYFALLRLGHIFGCDFKIIDVLKPVLYGCVIAYLFKSDCKKGRCIF